MNYYNPNYYQNNPYNNFQIPQQTQQSNNQMQTICGKMVDSVDIVKASEVPIGGYGVFPKADFSELYIKTWNNDGTTRIISFKPFEQKSESESILSRLDELEKKVEKLNKQPVKQEVKYDY